MTNKSPQSGSRAETAVANHLISLGYKILDQNWRTRRCEIDIVAEKSKKVFFIEVKYRSTSSQGSGLDYITNTKLRQMTYAADVWLSYNSWVGDSQLVVAQVSGGDFDEITLIYLD